MLPKEVEDAADAERLLDAWRQSWREGHFQLSNATKPPGQYSFKVIPPDKSRFQEKSGFRLCRNRRGAVWEFGAKPHKEKGRGARPRLGQNIQRKKSEPVMPPSLSSVCSAITKCSPLLCLYATARSWAGWNEGPPTTSCSPHFFNLWSTGCAMVR